eukprot:COSAG06_NODE_6202_length_3051_cov_6.132453_3_plen_167_part_00
MRLRTLSSPSQHNSRNVGGVSEAGDASSGGGSGGGAWEVLPAGLALPWVVSLGVYRAEQRDGLIHGFLAAPPRPDMRRLRLLPAPPASTADAEAAGAGGGMDDGSAWQLLPWGPVRKNTASFVYLVLMFVQDLSWIIITGSHQRKLHDNRKPLLFLSPSSAGEQRG